MFARGPNAFNLSNDPTFSDRYLPCAIVSKLKNMSARPNQLLSLKVTGFIQSLLRPHRRSFAPRNNVDKPIDATDGSAIALANQHGVERTIRRSYTLRVFVRNRIVRA